MGERFVSRPADSVITGASSLLASRNYPEIAFLESARRRRIVSRETDNKSLAISSSDIRPPQKWGQVGSLKTG